MSDLVLRPRPKSSIVSRQGPRLTTLPCEIRMMIFDYLFAVEEAAFTGNDKLQEEPPTEMGLEFTESRSFQILHRENLDAEQPTRSFEAYYRQLELIQSRKFELLQSCNVVLEPELNTTQLRRRMIPAICDTSRQLREEALSELYKHSTLRFAYMRTYETSTECLEKLERSLVNLQAWGVRFDVIAVPADAHWRKIEAKLLPGGSLGDVFAGMHMFLVQCSQDKVDGIPPRLFAPNPPNPRTRANQ